MSKVKIVAIAKDEGAYLPEWIFHHLYFGFDAIDIYVNRTTDNTTDILDKISNQYPNINYFYADWVDMHPKHISHFMQKIIYSQAFQDEKLKHTFTHLLFIDIDEFWTPLNFQDSIHICLASLPKYAAISFQWFNILGEKIAFDSISRKINGFLTPQIKSIYSTSSDIDLMRVHLSILHENNNFEGYFLSDGSSFVYNEDKPECISGTLAKTIKPYVILHRMFRSEVEYISMLYRGNPENSSKIKLNRMGFRETMGIQKHIDFEHDTYSKYKKEKEYFFKKIQINDDLAKARHFVLNRAQLTIKALQKEKNNNNNDKLIKVFNGLKNTQINSILEDMLNPKKQIIKTIKLEFQSINIKNFEKLEDLLEEMSSIFIKYKKREIADCILEEKVFICKDIKNIKTFAITLKKMALLFENKNDIDTAYELMEKAHWVKPNGKFIESKLNEYKKVLQKSGV